MNCHSLIGTDNNKLLLVRESWEMQQPIQWVRIHKLPDYVFFNHAAHLKSGVGCISCHGTDFKGGSSTVSCFTCHESYPHPDEFINGTSDNFHGKYIAEEVNWDITKCQTCHGND